MNAQGTSLSMSRRRLLAAGGALALSTPLAACGSQPGTSAPGGSGAGTAASTPIPARAAVTLEYWSRFAPTAGGGVEDKRVAEFIAANAPTKVERTTMPSDYVEKLNTAFAAGSGPDVYNVGGTGIPNFSAKGTALTVGAHPTVIKDLPDFVPAAIESCKYQGKINGLPYTLGPRAMVVRKDILADAGIDVAKFPDTWDDFRDAARRVTKRDGQDLVRAGFVVPTGTSGHDFFMTLHEQLGEHAFTADLSKPTFAGAVGQQALQTMVDMLNKDRLDGPDKPKPAPGLDTVVAGINVMAWTNTAPIVNARASAPQVLPALATLPIPKFKQRFTYLAGQYLMVSSKPKDVTGAVDFMLYLTAARHADEINSVESGVPPRKSAGNSPYIQDPLIKTMYDAVQYAWSVPNHAYYTEIRDVITAEITNAVSQKKSVQAALEDASRGAQDYLNRK